MLNLVKNLAALLVSALGVHAAYVFFIRPHAEQVLFQVQQQGGVAARSLSIILKDYEQETCIILMFWGVYLILGKCYTIIKQRYVFHMQLIPEPRQSDTASDSTMQKMQLALAEFERIEDARIRRMPLIKTLRTAIRRYVVTADVQNTSDAIVTGVEALAAQIESENSMIRYLIWAIPSIGFIGTVRGIGQALAHADAALAGDITGMTNSLGVAFNSTLVALVISILLMFLLHELQRLQDKLIVDTQAYCEEFVLDRIEKK